MEVERTYSRPRTAKKLGFYMEDAVLLAPLAPTPLRGRDQMLVAKAKPNRYRITTALDYRGLYGPEVDEALGVDEPTVDEWESGELLPTTEDIQCLATLTHFPVAFFYGVTMKEPELVYMCGMGIGPRGGCEATMHSDNPHTKADLSLVK